MNKPSNQIFRKITPHIEETSHYQNKQTSLYPITYRNIQQNQYHSHIKTNNVYNNNNHTNQHRFNSTGRTISPANVKLTPTKADKTHFQTKYIKRLNTIEYNKDNASYYNRARTPDKKGSVCDYKGKQIIRTPDRGCYHNRRNSQINHTIYKRSCTGGVMSTITNTHNNSNTNNATTYVNHKNIRTNTNSNSLKRKLSATLGSNNGTNNYYNDNCKTKSTSTYKLKTPNNKHNTIKRFPSSSSANTTNTTTTRHKSKTNNHTISTKPSFTSKPPSIKHNPIPKQQKTTSSKPHHYHNSIFPLQQDEIFQSFGNFNPNHYPRKLNFNDNTLPDPPTSNAINLEFNELDQFSPPYMAEQLNININELKKQTNPSTSNLPNSHTTYTNNIELSKRKQTPSQAIDSFLTKNVPIKKYSTIDNLNELYNNMCYK